MVVKLPAELDNPIDAQIHRALPALGEWAHQRCFTPNHITTLSMLGGILAIYALCTHAPTLFVFGYLVAYTADSLDGYVARKYNQVTEFGDYYDHVKDVVVHIVLFVVLFHLARKNKSLWVIGVLGVVLYLAMVHMRLMDKYYCGEEREGKKGEGGEGKSVVCESPTLATIDYVVPEVLLGPDVRAGLVATRWFGLGTFATLLMLSGAWLCGR